MGQIADGPHFNQS